jgi:hypothetical protein
MPGPKIEFRADLPRPARMRDAHWPAPRAIRRRAENTDLPAQIHEGGAAALSP